MQNPLEQHEVAIKEIFTLERLPAIIAVINSLRPPYGNWIKESEYLTVVCAAQTEAIDNLQRDLTNFVVNHGQLPTLPVTSTN